MEITTADSRSVCKYGLKFEFHCDNLETTMDLQDLCELGEYGTAE